MRIDDKTIIWWSYVKPTPSFCELETISLKEAAELVEGGSIKKIYIYSMIIHIC